MFNPTDSFADVEGDIASLLSSAGLSIWQDSNPVHLTNAAYGDIAASLVKVVTTAATDSFTDMLRRPRLESVVTKPGRQQLPTRPWDGFWERRSKVEGVEEPLKGALAASADRAAARHRTAAGQPAGCPTREEKGVSYMQKNTERKSEICKYGIRLR